MSLPATLDTARRGRLYPSVILHGGSDETRRQAALELARTLLCEAPPDERPCGVCRHCRRVGWAGGGDDAFHPDFLALERDLKTSTSVDATREMLRSAQLSPFEARGQVFVIASAETLSGEAANALLKALEEPHAGAPRNYLLLAPSQFDLLATLRSRSLAVFLGPTEAVDRAEAAPLAEAFTAAVAGWTAGGSPAYLLAAAAALRPAGGWDDPRSGRPWALAATAVLDAAYRDAVPAGVRRSLLTLAEALLGAPALRLRGIPAERILDGLVARHLGG